MKIKVNHEPSTWKFVFHKNGLHWDRDKQEFCNGKCTVMAVF